MTHQRPGNVAASTTPNTHLKVAQLGFRLATRLSDTSAAIVESAGGLDQSRDGCRLAEDGRVGGPTTRPMARRGTTATGTRSGITSLLFTLKVSGLSVTPLGQTTINKAYADCRPRYLGCEVDSRPIRTRKPRGTLRITFHIASLRKAFANLVGTDLCCLGAATA